MGTDIYGRSSRVASRFLQGQKQRSKPREEWTREVFQAALLRAKECMKISRAGGVTHPSAHQAKHCLTLYCGVKQHCVIGLVGCSGASWLMAASSK
jgi:hypothetical protein